MKVPHLSIAVLILACCLAFSPSTLAGKIELKNGTTIIGRPYPLQGLTQRSTQSNSTGPTRIFAFWRISDGVRNYYVPKRQVADLVEGAEPISFEEFKLKHLFKGGKRMFASVGSFAKRTPFSEFGRQIVTVTTAHGSEKIALAITKLNPKYVTIKALSYKWTFSKKTNSIPAKTLSKILHRVTDNENADERFAIAYFFLEAGMYSQAQSELAEMNASGQFPEMENRIKETALKLRQLEATQYLNELKLRRRAGQHALTYQSLEKFPTKDVNQSILNEVKEIQKEYDKGLEQIEHLLSRLGELQAGIKDKKLLNEVVLMRSTIKTAISYETLPRMAAFLQNEQDKQIPAEELLAMAYSGWVVGSANAVVDLKKTVLLWKARAEIEAYLKTEKQDERTLILSRLLQLEGVSPDTVDHLLDYLPPPIDTPDAQGGARLSLKVISDFNPPNYSVQLPTEYTPDRKYPAIVVLHNAGATPDHELDWWGGTPKKPGQGQRHGYIIIAPEYNVKKRTRYNYSTRTHEIVLDVLKDARKRFSIDSDRVFIGGHGMGADAVCDLGMSHPGLFAGAIPITGVFDNYCKFYKENAPKLHWYLVGGELDGSWLAKNDAVLNRIFKSGHDVICAEYKGRGRENYYSEISNIFEWMERLQRPPLQEKMKLRILRHSENSFPWFNIAGIPSYVTDPNRKRKTPLNIEIRHTIGNTIYFTGNVKKVEILLSPKQIDFDRKLKVTINGKIKYKDIPERNIGTMLEQVHKTGDRQNRFWMRITN